MLSLRSRRGDEPSRGSSASPVNERDAKRRKVRKGTHSCWECRRRKIRCQFASPEDDVCDGCRGRGSECRSQEFTDEQAAAQPERKTNQRLGRLEEMMELLLGKLMPEARFGRKTESGTADGRSGSASPVSATASEAGIVSARVADDLIPAVDVLESSPADETPVATLLGIQDVLSHSSPSVPTPNSDSSVNHAPTRPAWYLPICKELHDLFPSQRDIDVIVRASPGAHFATSLFHAWREAVAGRAPSPSSIAIVPPVSSHPALLTKRLLQLTMCMQQLSPAFHLQHKLQTKEPLLKLMNKILATVARLTACNDELMGFVEGLECLVLLNLCQCNAGNLRKSWMTARRALGLGQLMGIDRGSERALKSCDPTADTGKRPTPAALWYRITYCDRFLSLLLGLPLGTQDNSFATGEQARLDEPLERLEKKFTVIAARIVERNHGKAGQAFALTQEIDCELDVAAKEMGHDWWHPQSLDPFGAPEAMLMQKTQVILQIHRFMLLILLHVPYMLRDASENRYDYSKKRCMSSSREVLERFNMFRNLVKSAHSCRHVDYAALIAAMTLLLGYLGPRTAAQGGEPSDRQREADRLLVECARDRMEKVAILNQDPLSRASANMIKQLLPIIHVAAAHSLRDTPTRHHNPKEGSRQGLHLNIPYLGTVNIRHEAENVAVTANDSSVASHVASPGQDHLDKMGTRALDPPDNDPWQLDASRSAAGTFEHDGQDQEPVASVHSFGGLFMDLDMAESNASDFTFPEPTAEKEDWAFQGVDTTYWSLLQGGTNFDFES